MIGIVLSDSFLKLIASVAIIIFVERWGEEDVEIAHDG